MFILTFIINYIIPLIAIFSFIKVIIEYRNNQLWKESEFLSKEVKEFFSEEKIKTVLTLLDWNARLININGKDVKIDDAFMLEALKTHNKKSKFSLEEAYIRDLFDNFFDKLSYFKIHCKNGLVTEKKVYNYFEYYFEILVTNERKSPEFIRTINSYLTYYEYDNVKSLLDGYKKTKKRP